MSDRPTTTAIETRALGKTFRTRDALPTRAIVRVSLEVSKGQFVAVVGAPGSGKSTLLQLIGGVLRPTTGRANLFGYDVTRQPFDARALVRMASVDARAIHRRSTLRETVLASVDLAARRAEALEPRASYILERLGLAENARLAAWPSPPGTWVRVGLAVALLADPKIVLLDEPTAGLDETDARTFMGTLADLVRAHAKTVVVASRQVGLLHEYCDRIVGLDRGEVVFDCLAADTRRLPLTEVYRITVGGQLDDAWSDWFDGMRVVSTETGATILIGPVPDQSALHGLLMKVRDLGLPLLSLSRVEHGAFDVLRQLVDQRQINAKAAPASTRGQRRRPMIASPG
jgi:ABC-type multidrug transport system ATPase subunit